MAKKTPAPQALDRSGSQVEFAGIVNISTQAVQKLKARGIIDTNRTLLEMLHMYCAHLRKRAEAAGPDAGLATRKDAEPGELDLTEERAKLARAQTEKIDMELAVRRAELIPAGDVTAALSSVAAQAAAILDSIPVKLKRESPHLSASDIEIVKRELARARNVMASIEHESAIKCD